MAKAKVKVFVSSPTQGIVEHRNAVSYLARDLSDGVNYEIYLYEFHKRSRGDETPSERILKDFGKHCDIFIIFFKDILTAGMMEEFQHYKKHFMKDNPKCELWWSHIQGGRKNADVDKLLGEIEHLGTELAAIRSAKITPTELEKRLYRAFVEYGFNYLANRT